ncbi:DNA alkylation repair protein [Winogradskyella poriferorum]|uniref:DNA alkylation repair protein n=1 Tax=Winogradskyella poriferorum TaxID=307627 RepID=UPI003D6466B4
MSFVLELSHLFEDNRNEINAKAMQAYMKNKFDFFGIKSPVRKHILKDVVNSKKDEVISKTETVTKALYEKPQREFHYCAMEIYSRFKKRNYIETDLNFITYLITTHSHWDSVDFIAKHILGQYLLELPEKKDATIETFSKSDNMWLNRSAILFQLGYKDKTDADLLFSLCENHKHSDAFFIKKAIGWVLREYAKTNSKAVIEFVKSNNLKPLSEKEALKHFK